ncbi:hypothetical protein AHF37_08636 [Paragonimus kellicotti]|nr:hypothetical protein AHF37_08636 [Paragonimus kellicotti]
MPAAVKVFWMSLLLFSSWTEWLHAIAYYWTKLQVDKDSSQLSTISDGILHESSTSLLHRWYPRSCSGLFCNIGATFACGDGAYDLNYPNTIILFKGKSATIQRVIGILTATQNPFGVFFTFSA